MSTASIGASPASVASSHPWWRRALVSLGIGVAVFTPLLMWWRRRSDHDNS